MSVQGAEVVSPADTEQSRSTEPEQARWPLAHVEAVNPEVADEGLEDPGDAIVVASFPIAAVGLAVHARDEKEVDEPPDEEKAARDEPDDAGDWPSIVEAMGSGETENPEQVADGL